MSNFINGLKNFQVIPRELIFDNSLSDRARFIYCFMASKPDGWDFLLNPMAKELGYSVETLRKYINELIAGGWLKKGEQNNDGKFGAVVYTLLSTKNADTEKNRHEEIPTQENTDSENFRHGEKPAQYNKDNEENKESIEKKDFPNKEEKDKSFSKKEHIDYNAIVKCWNETNPTLATVRMLNDKRKSKIRTLLSSNSATVEDLLKAIKIISMSSFCQGKNDRNWEASFDWLINDTKSCFSRLFEGAYSFTQDEKRELKEFLGEENERTKPSLPEGWTQERYDMFIRNGYTITPEGRVFLDGKEYK